MKHEEAEKKIDQYLLKWLSPEESEAFEAHYMECEECFKELSLSREYSENLRAVLEQRQLEPEFPASEKPATITQIKQLFRSGASLVLRPAVAYLVILALLYPAYRGISRRPEVAVKELVKQVAEEKQKPSNEVEALREKNAAYQSQIADLNKKAQELSSENQKQMAELKAVSKKLADSIKPVANPAVLALAFLNIRSSDQAEGIVFKDQMGLEIETRFDEENRFSRYTLRIVDERGRTLWQQEPVEKNRLGGVTVRIPRAFLKAGTYTLQVYGTDQTKKRLIKQDRFVLIRA